MNNMWLRLSGKLALALALLAGVWSLRLAPGSASQAWIHPVGGPPGPVRILRFYASTGSIALGDKAQLCYGVENAKSVRISPSIAELIPAANRCVEIVPEHTTHYTIQAEGFDGHVATRFVTLVVQSAPAAPVARTNVAVVLQCVARLVPTA